MPHIFHRAGLYIGRMLNLISGGGSIKVTRKVIDEFIRAKRIERQISAMRMVGNNILHKV